jgi:hypothetical protein
MIESEEVIYYWGVVTFYTEKAGKNFARILTAIRCPQSFVHTCRLLRALRELSRDLRAPQTNQSWLCFGPAIRLSTGIGSPDKLPPLDR